MHARFMRILLAMALSLLVFGCAKPPLDEPVDTTPSFTALSSKDALILAEGLSLRHAGMSSWTELRPALEDNLAYILRRPQDAVCVNRPGLTLTWGQLAESVNELLDMLEELDREPELAAERFEWLKLTPNTLLTGYYEPWLEASLERTEEFDVPLYSVPEDLMRVDLGRFHPRWKGQTLMYRMGEDGVEPYHDRASIDGEGVLEGQGLEIAWVREPVDVFFLQIQGSGRLVLPDGSVKHILYGGKNGRQYVSIGRLLIERGLVPREEMSMQRIRAYLSENPDQAMALFFENPSYVFFHLSDEGPFGSLGSILTPKVSVAVDRTVIPLGGVAALKTALVDYETGEVDPFLSLVLAQDTGGAIKGTRMDLFCGSGDDAEWLAGHLQERSEVFLLMSKRVLSEMK